MLYTNFLGKIGRVGPEINYHLYVGVATPTVPF